MNLAPNGKTSNLTPEQYRLVRTPAFKKWFGDWENDAENSSRVIDSNGEPLLVWHGSKSNENFNVFKQSSRFEFIYFAKTKEYAWFHFTKDIIDKPFQLRPFFLNIRNLLNAEEYGFEKVDFSELKSFFYGIHELSKDIQLNPKSQYKFWEVLRFSNDIYHSLKNQDYDGISFYENFYDNTTWNDTDDYSLSYVVMNPNQIKLADGSNTTFNSGNPDIRYKQGANIKNKTMEKEIYCVVVVQFDNGVKRTTEVMPKQLATEWVHKYGGRAENCEVFECTPDGEIIRKIETPKMELGGGVGLVKNEKNEYALYPENPTKKSMGLLLEYGGTMNTSEDMGAPILGGTMGSSMRDGGNVDKPNEIKAKTYKEWLALMRKDNNEHNQNAHQDDVIPFWEWVSEMGAMYGFKPMKDGSGDTIVVRTQDNPPNKEEVLAYIKESKSAYADEDGDLDEVGEELLAEDIAEKFNIDILSAYDYFEQTEMKNGGTVGADWQVMFESKTGSGKVTSVIVQATNLAEAKSKGWVKSGLNKKYVAFLTAYEKKQLGGNTLQKKNDSDDISQYYDMEFDLGGAVPNQKQRDIITKKIGLSEQNADYLIDKSPKFAVWLADITVKEKFEDQWTRNKEEDENPLPPVKEEENQKKIDTIYVLNNSWGRQTNLVRWYNDGIRLILDWLMHPFTPKQNLRELSYAEAVKKANKWHDELQALGGDINFVESQENEIIKRYPLTDDGVEYYWVRIPKAFCDIESRRMGHCGRTGHGMLISLRSIKPYGKGYTINDSHVTIAYNEDDNLFYQVKGKKNQKPTEKYYPYIYDLIKTFASTTNKLFKGFGSEYEASEDYGFDDMTAEQVGELYKINSKIFDDFAGQVTLYNFGLIPNKPSTEFTLNGNADDIDVLVRISREFPKNFIKQVLEGSFDNYNGSFGYYYDNLKECFDIMNAENEQTIAQEVMRITNHTLKQVMDNGIYNYLIGNIEEFHEDEFDDINRALVNAHVIAETQAYEGFWYDKLKDTLGELGFVKELNDEGVILEIDLSDSFTNQQIGMYMKKIGSNNLIDVFYEAVNDGLITLPKLWHDQRIEVYPESKEINSIFAEQNEFKRGGTTIAKGYGKASSGWKHKRKK
jgi:hypothetical protein